MNETIDVRDAAAGILGEMLARLEELRSSGTDEAKKEYLQLAPQVFEMCVDYVQKI